MTIKKFKPTYDSLITQILLFELNHNQNLEYSSTVSLLLSDYCKLLSYSNNSNGIKEDISC